MLYLRISTVRNPTTRRLLTTNVVFGATAGTYNIGGTFLRNSIDRLTSVTASVQAPGSGAGLGSSASFNCYSYIAAPVMTGASGGNGAAGCFWTITGVGALISNSSMVINNAGLCEAAPISVTVNGGFGGRGGRASGAANTNNGGGTIGSGVNVNFTSISFTLPSGGAGGSAGNGSRRRDSPSTTGNPPPEPGVAGTATTSTLLGNSGPGGTGGVENGCYANRRAPGNVTSRGSFSPPASGTIIYPNPASPRNIPSHSVTVFTTNLYGQGGLGGLPATTLGVKPAVIPGNNGNNGAVLVIATSIRI
jgi:hypothetical protein